MQAALSGLTVEQRDGEVKLKASFYYYSLCNVRFNQAGIQGRGMRCNLKTMCIILALEMVTPLFLSGYRVTSP